MSNSADVNQQDPYTYKGTSVLVNKRDFRSPEAAKQLETDAVIRRSVSLPESLKAGPLDATHFSSVHRHLFQDVYSWAGEFRSVNLSKGESTFTRADRVETQGNAIFAALAKDKHLAGLDKPAFVEKLTDYYSQVNAWHPFREGNGRTTRLFFDVLAQRAGYRLDMRGVTKQEWNDAAALSMKGDKEPLKKIFTMAARPRRAVAFEVGERYTVLQRFPELQGAYDMYDGMLRKALAEFPNNRQARDRFAVQAKDTVQLYLDAGKVPNVQKVNQQLAKADQVPTKQPVKAAPVVIQQQPQIGGRGR